MKWGVPFEGYVGNFVGTVGVAVFIVGNPMGFAAGFAVHFILRELCRVDPHFFRKWRMFFETKARSTSGAIWGGSRLQPSPTRVRRSRDVATYV